MATGLDAGYESSWSSFENTRYRELVSEKSNNALSISPIFPSYMRLIRSDTAALREK